MAYKSQYEKDLEYAGERIIEFFGKKPKKPITIYTVLNHVSRSGMMRKISAFIIVDNKPICIARETKVSGCGMDMGFDLAYSIFHTVYGYGKPKYQEYLNHQWL